jgi:membrane protease YdiL (CAAX protease family)
MAESSEPPPPEGESPDEDVELSSAGVVRAAIIFEGLLGVAAYFLGELVHRPPGERIHWNLADAGWGVAAAVPPLVMLLVLMRLPLAAVDRLREFSRQFLIPMFREARWWQILLICAFAGLGEEMLFRGVIQLGLTDAIGGTEGIVAGLAIGGITFGLAHAATRTYAIAATLIGLYFGGVLLTTGNLLVPIIAHAVYDVGAFVYLFWMEDAPLTNVDSRAAGLEHDSRESREEL